MLKVTKKKAAESQSSTELSAQDYKSCKNVPLMKPDHLPDSTLVLSICPPPELHCMLGITFDLYKLLDKELDRNNCSISAIDWAKLVGAEPTAYHGGAFTGPDCVKLLQGTAKLKELLQANGILSVGGRVGAALEKFNIVRKACFGVKLDKDYKVALEEFNKAYVATGIQSNSLKAHIVGSHVKQFLDLNKNLGKGLGHWSEQAVEHLHGDFDNMYVGSKYNRSLEHKEYAPKLFACVIAYNSSHEGDEFCD